MNTEQFNGFGKGAQIFFSELGSGSIMPVK